MTPLRIALMISGRGSNMKAILEAIQSGMLRNVEATIVLSDNRDADGLQIAETFGVPAIYIDCAPYKTKLDGSPEERVIDILKKYDVDLICLAGFMRMIKTKLISTYRNRIINIHPSLLPSFPGLEAQRQAFEAGVPETGCSVHFVDEGMDTGPIIRQAKLPVLKDDSLQSLSRRILRAEHEIYWRVIQDIANGKIAIG